MAKTISFSIERSAHAIQVSAEKQVNVQVQASISTAALERLVVTVIYELLQEFRSRWMIEDDSERPKSNFQLYTLTFTST